jgi:XRE family aerobic/anaerobic benzoate catabolism transcriptional regulator
MISNLLSSVGAAETVDTEAYLAALGERVRQARARHGMTRKILARDSGVSERYIAQLESGHGNISILLLRQLASALDTPLDSLVAEGPEPPPELQHSVAMLRRLSAEEMAKAYQMLRAVFGSSPLEGRHNRIALIGLKGAGKSTLGAKLAKAIDCPFIELDKEIEKEAGASLSAIFDLYGQKAFRRLERRCLERVIKQHPRAVIETGGGLVSDPSTYARLLESCFTVWVRATPAEHMARVVAQGDMRPMANNREAMADLQHILSTRERLYSKADAQLDTSKQSPEESLEQLLSVIG